LIDENALTSQILAAHGLDLNNATDQATHDRDLYLYRHSCRPAGASGSWSGGAPERRCPRRDTAQIPRPDRGRSIPRWSFDVVDHKQFNRGFSRFQLEPEFLQELKRSLRPTPGSLRISRFPCSDPPGHRSRITFDT
jgi:hypothetical protein